MNLIAVLFIGGIGVLALILMAVAFLLTGSIVETFLHLTTAVVSGLTGFIGGRQLGRKEQDDRPTENNIQASE